MIRAILQRTESSNQGTFGRLVLGGLVLFTAELPWRENASNRSCIPPGLYHAAWTWSPRYSRKMYLLAPTAPRTGIRVHKANYAGDVTLGLRCHLNGCVALGEKLGWLDGQKAVLLSAPAIRRLEAAAGGQPFDLEIKPC